MLGLTKRVCWTCGEWVKRRHFAHHLCAHTALPEPPRLDLICPGVVQAESGTLYYSGALLMQIATRTGRLDAEDLAGVIGEILQAVTMAPEVH